MALTSLAERQARLEQQRARLLREEAKIREDARKARTRGLIEAGGLVAKAGLGELDANVLLGALLEVASKLGDPEQLARWAAEGGRAFDREAKAREAHKEPLILTLAGAQPALATVRLRRLGFRWSKVLRHWEGLAVFDEAKAMADELGGTLQRMAPPTSESEAAARMIGQGGDAATGMSAGPSARPLSSEAAP
jgi:hypothetical protein